MLRKIIHGPGKRGVTEMVAYVALIIVAFSVSIIVYNYLEVSAPKNRPQCPEGVSLAIIDAVCKVIPHRGGGVLSALDLTLENKGRHSVDGVYVRIGTKDQKVKTLLNNEKIFFTNVATAVGKYELPPRHSVSQSYNGEGFGIAGSGEYAIEVQPVIGSPGNIAICEDAVITRTISCEYPLIPGGVPEFVAGTYEYPSKRYPLSNPLTNYEELAVTATPPVTLADFVSHLEVALYKREGGNWNLQGTHEAVTTENGGSTYLYRWGSLSTGTYRAEAILYLYDQNRLVKVPVRQGGANSREFTLPSVTFICNDYERPDVVFYDYPDSHREVSITNRCDSATSYVHFICNYRNVYEGISESEVKYPSIGNSCPGLCVTNSEQINGQSHSIGRCE